MCNIEEVDFKKLFENRTESIVMSIIGNTGSGKTTMLKYILSQSALTFTHRFLIQGSIASKDNIYIDHFWPDDIVYVDNTSNGSDKKKELENVKNDIDEYRKKIISINTLIRDIKKKNSNSDLREISTLFVFDDLSQSNKIFSEICDTIRHSNVCFIFITHNDTDLDLKSRKKVSHYIVNVKYNTTQITEDFFKDKSFKTQYENIKQKFLEKQQDKTFLILNTKNPNKLEYKNLIEEEIRTIKNDNSMFKLCSQQKYLLKKYLTNLAKNLKNKGV